MRYLFMVVSKGVEYMVKNNKKILWAAVICSIIFVIIFHYAMLSTTHISNLSVHFSNHSKIIPPLSFSHGSNPNMFPLFG